MKHTPGPWTEPRIYQNNACEPHRITIYGGSKTVHSMLYNDGKFMSWDEMKANAQLIAAAPDLLGALDGLFKHCEMVHKFWGDNSNQKEADAAIQAARDAIQKATN